MGREAEILSGFWRVCPACGGCQGRNLGLIAPESAGVLSLPQAPVQRSSSGSRAVWGAGSSVGGGPAGAAGRDSPRLARQSRRQETGCARAQPGAAALGRSRQEASHESESAWPMLLSRLFPASRSPCTPWAGFGAFCVTYQWSQQIMILCLGGRPLKAILSPGSSKA